MNTAKITTNSDQTDIKGVLKDGSGSVILKITVEFDKFKYGFASDNFLELASLIKYGLEKRRIYGDVNSKHLAITPLEIQLDLDKNKGVYAKHEEVRFVPLVLDPNKS